jgi:uncharacterized protein YaeQ
MVSHRAMALSATLRRFEIALADSDREVYEQLELRVAQHPSESSRYCAARVIARCLEHAEGVDFSKAGLGDDAEPALVQRDLRGDLQAWIEVGLPSADRLHKASKACKRVVVYTWKRAQLDADLADRATPIHRADELEIHTFDPEWLDRIASTLDRVNRWDLSRSGGTLYLTIGGGLFETTM